ncbi:hypothetical protein BH10ACT11_BH10ACT11_03370 [soil metagenome]
MLLIGPFSPSLAGSELSKRRGELEPGLPETSIERVAAALVVVRAAVRSGEITAAHDVSDGGLACALAEMAIASGVGVESDLSELIEATGCEPVEALFGEGPGGIVLSGGEAAMERLRSQAGAAGVACTRVGTAQGEKVRLLAGETEISVPVEAAQDAWLSLGPSMAS